MSSEPPNVGDKEESVTPELMEVEELNEDFEANASANNEEESIERQLERT